jgi:RND family efflux transporter MFP subunit
MRRSHIFVAALIGVTAAAARSSGQEAAIETTKVVAQALDKTVSIPGDLAAYQAVSVHARVAGFVESVAVDRGSWVSRGQSLAKLTAPELIAQRLEAEAKVQAIRAQHLEAEAKAISAESTHDRLAAAAKTPGVVSGHDVEIAAKALDAARAHTDAIRGSAAAAEAALGAVRELEKYLEIRAPFDGVITERNVHPGSLVGPSGSPMLRIEQLSRLRLVVPVPENYVGGMKKGMLVNFKVSAFPSETFQGVLARPAYTLDVRTRSMLVELDVPNAKSVLSPGMFADVQWPVSRAQVSLFVPPSAVVRTTERQFVVRIRSGVADWVDVRRGATSGALLEVFGELREGDVVVRRGNDEIRPGSKIIQKAAR